MFQQLLIIFLASFLCYNWADEQIVLKPDDPFLFLGECLTLTCTLSSTLYGNSSTLFITVSGKRFSDNHYEIVDEKTMKFNRCIEDLNEAGTYFCKQNRINSTNTTQSIFSGQVVYVEKALVPIPKDSIDCIVFNWTNMNCSWSLGQTYSRKQEINVSLTYQIINKPLECPKLEQNSCQWTKSDADLSVPFEMNLTVFHRKRPQKKFLTVFNLPRKKPVKPKKVSLKSIFTNSSCVKVEWTHGYFFKLKFNIAITSEFQSQNVTLRQRSKLFCDLLPQQKYKIYVTAYPKRDPGIWSEPLIIDISTNKTYPSQPPLLSNSSFKWNENHSAVKLYWQSLTRRQSGTAKVWYIIEVDNQTIKADLGDVWINLPPHQPDNKCWVLQIWAENSFSRSKESSSIRICNSTLVPSASENVVMLILNKTHVKVMWLEPSLEKTSVSSFQVLMSKNRSVDLQWWDVDGNESFMIIPLENADLYSFGVAAKNSHGSSELTWGSCFYQVKKPKNPVKLLVKSFSRKIQIYWEPYNCYSEKAFILGYNVKYCKARNATECSEIPKWKLVPSSQGNYQTSELSPNDYLVWVEPVSEAGSGPSSKMEMVKISVKSLDTPITLVIVGFSIILFILILFGFKHLYKKCSAEIAKCDPPIDFPQIASENKTFESDLDTNSLNSGYGQNGSPVSSTDTVITNLPDSSLQDSSKEISDSSQHIYTKVEAMSSNSLESPENSCSSSKALLDSTSKQNANNNAFCRVNSVYVDFSNSSDKSSLNSQHNLLQDVVNTSDNSSHFQIDFNNIHVKFAKITDDTDKFANQTPAEDSTEAKDLEQNLPNENYFDDYISEDGINKSSVSEENSDSLPSNISAENPEFVHESTMIDDYQPAEKVFKLNNFSAEKVKIKPTTGGKNIRDTCELHDMNYNTAF